MPLEKIILKIIIHTIYSHITRIDIIKPHTIFQSEIKKIQPDTTARHKGTKKKELHKRERIIQAIGSEMYTFKMKFSSLSCENLIYAVC